MNVSKRLAVLGLCLGGLLAAPVRAQDASYQQAVAAYVTAAREQVHAMQTAVESRANAVSDDQKAVYDDTYEKLERYANALAKLEQAGPRNFDRAKAQFEHARNEVSRSLSVAEQKLHK